MPTYTFVCDGCQTVHELRRRMADAGLPAACPDCGARMRRRFEVYIPIIFRPPGYALRPDDPDYWTGFDDPLPKRTEVQKAVRTRRSRDKDDHHFSA